MGKENHLSLNALIARFHAPTPIFWKAVRLKVAYYGSALTAFGGALALIPDLPKWLSGIGVDLCKFVPVVIALVGLMASLTVNPENPPTDKL